MNFNKPFLKGAVAGILIYLVINLFVLLLGLPFFLGYYSAIVFALLGGLTSLLLNKKKLIQ